MLQYLAQGAGMAMEDALCLAKCLDENETVEAAFAAYPKLRYLRTGRVQLSARVYGEFYHARGVAAELRELALSPRTAEDTYDSIAWLYGGP
jgi:salicylate hydroxylase